MKKRIVAVLLSLAMILPMCPAGVISFPVSAATSGTTGDCTWTLNGTELVAGPKGELPELAGVSVSGTVEVAPGSCAFIVL